MEFLNRTFGKYKLNRAIGDGGMACVYEAIHEKIGTRVAVKVLNPILARNPEIRKRFENEANLMATLDHPNITRVMDLEEQDGTLAIVMELLDGEDLASKIIRQGPLNLTEIIEMFNQVLDAFEHAHSKGIVHRDIKPANIFVDRSNRIKILDFGIAKSFGTGVDMTQTGTQIGTPTYMSPEQVKGDKSIDHRSDIYSLGVTLYFLKSGSPPFSSEEGSSFEIFTKIVHDNIPTLNNSFIDGLIAKASAKDRNQRFQSIQEFKQEFNLISENYNAKGDLKDGNVLSKLEDLKNHDTQVIISSDEIAEREYSIVFKNLEIGKVQLGNMDWYKAKIHCQEMGDGWRLPSLSDLEIIYKISLIKGNFEKERYWSSNEFNKYVAFEMNFSNGKEGTSDKVESNFVLIVRNLEN